MRKNAKKIIAIMLTMVMLGAMAVPAMAWAGPGTGPNSPAGGENFGDPGLVEGGNDDIQLSKRLTSASDTITIPIETFAFAFAPESIDGDTTVTASMPSITGVTITTTSSDTWAWDSTDLVYYSTINLSTNLESTLAAASWPRAGVYVYTVSETAASTTGMTYSGEEYTMTVHVINAASGGVFTGGYTIHAVEFRKTMEFDGTTPGSGAKTTPLFTNRIVEETTLVISKTVTGAYGDLTKEFDYSITLTDIPGGAGTYTAAHLNASGALISNITVGLNATFKLKHGEKLVFDGTNGSTKLLAGVAYELTETGVANYLPSVVVTTSGAASAAQTATNAGDSLTIGNPTPIAVGIHASNPEPHNLAVWTNDFPDPPTPTGILLDNLPFILLILVGIGGIVGYIALKRRRAHR